MIPNDELSDPTVYTPFIFPRNGTKESLVDYHMGAGALNNPAGGFAVTKWTARYVGGQILLSRGGAATAVLTRGGIVNFSFAFDQQMRPCVAYQLAGGGAEFWWFDPDASEYVTLDLGDAVTPRVVLDDTAPDLLATSDVVLTYLLDGILYAREQRDSFAVEYELDATRAGYRLGQFGKNEENRLQWQLYKVQAVPPAPPPPGAPLLEVLDVRAFFPDDADLAPFVYIAAAADYAGFHGVSIELSRDDGDTWTPVGALGAGQASIIGVTTATLAAHASPDPDEAHTLEVELHTFGAALVATDADGLEFGANLAAVEDELLQFRDVAGAAPAFDLDYLLRDRFGSGSPEHAAASRFVVMDRSKVLLIPLTMDDVGETLKFRAKATGGTDYTERTLVFAGNNLGS